MKEPPRLGRGLASLFGDSAAMPANAAETGSTPIGDLEPNPFQPRSPIDDEDLTELADSIREQGVLQPILVRRHPTDAGRFQIIAGERRWRAAKLAGLSRVPSYIRDLTDNAASAAALVENLQRKDLNPIEEAEGFRRLIDSFGLTQDELARAIGKSRSHVANQVRLLNLPDHVLLHVRTGALSAGHARAALACADPAAAAATMLEQGLNVRQAEALAARATELVSSKPERDHPAERGTADLRAVEADLAERLGLKVSISFNGRGGTVSLRYQSLDQLDHVVARLGR